MVRILLSIFFISTFTLNVFAETVQLNTLNEPELTTSIKNEIESLDRESLKEVHEHYYKQIGNVISFLKLSTGREIEWPNTTTTITRNDYIYNIYNLKNKAAEIFPQANIAMSKSLERLNGIKLVLSDLVLKDGYDSCTINPIVGIYYSSEVHLLPLSCELDTYPKKKLSTHLTFGYSSDLKIRTVNKDLIEINILSNDSNSVSTTLETYDDEISLSFKLSYKPVD